MSRRVFNIIRNAFGLKGYVPSDKDFKDMYKSISSLEFDGISKGKENLRGDVYNLDRDFRKSVDDAKSQMTYDTRQAISRKCGKDTLSLRNA